MICLLIFISIITLSSIYFIAPGINKLKEAKVLGENQRTKNDIFYLALAMAKLEGKVNLDNIKEILSTTFPTLNFSNLLDVIFVGDGTYLDFEDKFVEIRPSGTDAKTKAYAGGDDKQLLINFADTLGNYSGVLNETYKKYIDEKYVDDCKENSFKVYDKYSTRDEDNRQFVIPNYSF